VRNAYCFALILGALQIPGWPQANPAPSKLLDILAEELDRNFQALKKADPAPYFISYAITEDETHAVQASNGALVSANSRKHRYLDVTVRVGSPKLDNYHRIRGEFPRFASGATVSLDDEPNSVKRTLWLETDRVYRAAAQRLIRIRTNQEVKVAEEDNSDDFSVEKPVVARKPVAALTFDREGWSRRVRAWSALYRDFPDVLSSSTAATAQREVKYFVSSEGARLEHGRTFARVLISAYGKAADGMNLSAGETFEAVDPSRLPADKVIQAAVKKSAMQLGDLLRAPLADPFVGPAILSGRAAGVFFHEIFGHRVEGHRQKDEAEGQTFTKSVGQPVLPDFLSVTFDPLRHTQGAVDLNGWYDYDDEGVEARRVGLVENGILKTFLLSRSPIKGFPSSNGHGRKQPGAEVVSRQSNLIVDSGRRVPEAALRKMLIDEVKRQNKPYGLYFEHVTSGYTTTGRRGLQAFTVVPQIVYRVYGDGRADELVRGVDIVGTPLASFAKIAATSDTMQVFNGYCGAESGNVPVSAVAPALLVSDVEIQKKDRSQDLPPILTRPAAARSAQ